MGKNQILSIVISAIGAVVISFFVFAFVDFDASSPGGGATPVSEQENQSEDNTTDENTTGDSNKGQSQEGEATRNTNISNSVQNDVNGEKANVSNDVQNNVNGDNADVNNTIDNHLNNSNNNQIQNNVSNDINVNVNVNVANNINNNANAEKSSSDSKNEESNNKDGNENSNEKKNSDESNKNNGNKDNEEANNQDRTLWGVDSANLTTEEMLACVRNNFGSPEIWGRYLGDKEGVSAGLTSEEIELLHSNDIKILVIWNHFDDATGYENGKNEATEAIQMARNFGIPKGVALFADIEPSYPVDSEFIRGWFEVMSNSEYKPGIYGVFDKDELYNAFEQAAKNNQALLEDTYIWTAFPNVGITTEANAPEYKPAAPENALIGGWQYGLEAKTCNIDTNLFHSDILDVVW